MNVKCYTSPNETLTKKQMAIVEVVVKYRHVIVTACKSSIEQTD